MTSLERSIAAGEMNASYLLYEDCLAYLDEPLVLGDDGEINASSLCDDSWLGGEEGLIIVPNPSTRPTWTSPWSRFSQILIHLFKT